MVASDLYSLSAPAPAAAARFRVTHQIFSASSLQAMVIALAMPRENTADKH